LVKIVESGNPLAKHQKPTLAGTRELRLPNTIDVLIVGAGPAGIAAALELKKRGVKEIVIAEREFLACAAILALACAICTA
jgi:NADPH-dependent 2,4-dienoyl-CoA reductase/sulfur reductase-like enzyme